MRRTAPSLILILAVVLGAGTPATAAPDTPHAALSRLKRAVARNDYASEWALLSPGFKKRMSERAGRNVDLADYAVFRRKQLRDPQIRQVQRYMRTARMGGVRYDNRGYAGATITFGGPLFFGRSIRIRMVQHKLWRLEIKGESQAYWGFVGDRTHAATKGADGSYTIVTKDANGKVAFEQTFEASEVRGYWEFGKWFFDHFGRMETEFFGS